MPRARSTNPYWQTAATLQEEQGSGCLSGFALPPLAIILFSAVFAYFVLRQPASSPLNIEPAASRGISPIFRIEIHYWANSILKWAAESQLDPNLIATVMQIESCGDPRARSSAGAMGLFQVMPFHFYTADDPYNPTTNALRGLAYLARSLKVAGGNARLALAGYNGGISLIGRAEWSWPAQTKRYVQFGWPIYDDAANGNNSSTSLNEWYEKYGVSLCRQAHQRLGLP